MSKYLVTGGSGFIAGHLIDLLLAEGHEVVSFDRYRHHDDPRVQHFLGDITDYAAITEAVGITDGVFHLAGVLGTSETIDNPAPAVQTNIVGGLNVFQSVRQHDKPCVYITVGNWWMNNSYSITKTTAERFAWMFNREHGTRISVVRALNAYGPRQKAQPVRKIMPNFVIPALVGDPIMIYGDGQQIMDMIHAADVADVLHRAMVLNDRFSFDPEPNVDNPLKFDAGSGRLTTVNDIAKVVLDAVGLPFIEGETVVHVPMRGGEPEHSVVVGQPDTLKPLYDGFVPLFRTLEDGVAETVGWYLDNVVNAS